MKRIDLGDVFAAILLGGVVVGGFLFILIGATIGAELPAGPWPFYGIGALCIGIIVGPVFGFWIYKRLSQEAPGNRDTARTAADFTEQNSGHSLNAIADLGEPRTIPPRNQMPDSEQFENIALRHADASMPSSEARSGELPDADMSFEDIGGMDLNNLTPVGCLLFIVTFLFVPAVGFVVVALVPEDILNHRAAPTIGGSALLGAAVVFFFVSKKILNARGLSILRTFDDEFRSGPRDETEENR